jgi:4-amino-4-deoxy-L-arabinose transferase-like glycosyltransferase
VRRVGFASHWDTRAWLILLLAVGLLVRGGVFLAQPHPTIDYGLVHEHGEVARQIVDHGRWFVLDERAMHAADTQDRHVSGPADIVYGAAPELRPATRYMPGLALLLAAIWKLTGDQHYVYVQLVQLALDLAMVGVVFVLSMRLFGRRGAALTSAGLYAALPTTAGLARIPHVDVWAVHFTAVLMLLTLRALDSDAGRSRLLALAVGAGAAVYFRPFAVLIPVVVALCFRGVPGRRRLVVIAAPVVAAVLALAPWAVRNAVQLDGRVVTQTGTGQALWEGFGEIADNPMGAVLDDAITGRQVIAERPDIRPGTVEYDAFLLAKARRAIVDHPLFYARLLAYRLYRSTLGLRQGAWVEGLESPSAWTVRTARPKASMPLFAPVPTLLWLIYLFAEPLIAAAAIVTAISLRRRYPNALVVTAAVTVAIIAPYIAIHVTPRYVAPVLVPAVMLAGLGLQIAWASRRSWRRLPARAVGRAVEITRHG